jgi:urease gamma subunit
MMQESVTIGYDQFKPQPRERRIQIFNEISAENRALLIQTHIKRWLAINRYRLTSEQVAVVEESIRFISSEKYEEGRDMEKIHREVEGLLKKAEAVLSREDVMQILSDRSSD